MTTVYRGVLKERILYPESTIITTDNLDDIDFSKVIYCEISPEGAMGNEGGIVLYVLENEDSLTTYETNEFIDKQAFEAVEEKIGQNRDFFTNYYGGAGNYVHIRKSIDLEIDEKYQCFWYHSKTTKLRIDSSVEGVFLAVVAEMTS